MLDYSFDDYSLGKLGPTKRALVTKELRRPPGLNTPEWYALAKQICELLNRNLRDR